MKIMVDGMGGDDSPLEIVKGTVDAVNEYGIEAIIVGPEDIIGEELKKYDYSKNRIEIMHAEDIITNEDDPALAIRRKKDSTIVVGMNALKEAKADAFVSAGSTGALLAGGLFIVKRIKGIKRAAITSAYPNLKGVSLLVDAGANVDSKAEYLDQFALMGSIYMEQVRKIKDPKVALVNIGDEVEKGNNLSKQTYELLGKNEHINFTGNIEARDIPMGKADVLVADGFVGNIVLKLTEGVAMSLMLQLKEVMTANTRSKMGGFLLKPAMKEFAKELDYREYGGAPLLGTQKPIIKAHGSSDAYAFKNAIRQAINFVENDVISIIEREIQEEK